VDEGTVLMTSQHPLRYITSFAEQQSFTSGHSKAESRDEVVVDKQRRSGRNDNNISDSFDLQLTLKD